MQGELSKRATYLGLLSWRGITILWRLWTPVRRRLLGRLARGILLMLRSALRRRLAILLLLLNSGLDGLWRGLGGVWGPAGGRGRIGIRHDGEMHDASRRNNRD